MTAPKLSEEEQQRVIRGIKQNMALTMDHGKRLGWDVGFAFGLGLTGTATLVVWATGVVLWPLGIAALAFALYVLQRKVDEPAYFIFNKDDPK